MIPSHIARSSPTADSTVVIPTYNERENIGPLLRHILDMPRFRVLVVDDNSPDGTAEIVAHMAQSEPRVGLLSRPGKLGLGTAYIAGFRRALAEGASYIYEMDADFSHDPRYLPVMDATGGFRCYRRRVLETLDLDAIHSNGYSFQIEMVYRTLQAGFQVGEVPIIFPDRRVGRSKMSRRIVFEALLTVWRLRLSRPVPALKQQPPAISGPTERQRH